MSPIIGARGGLSARAFGFGSFLAPAGDFLAITTATVDSGGASTVSFTSIPSTYKHLQIRAITRATQAAGGTDMNTRFNTDSATNYSYHAMQGAGSGAGAAFGGSSQTYVRNQSGADGSDPSGVFQVSIYDIFEYGNSNMYKTVRAITGYDNISGGFARILAGNWRSTSGITSIEFYPPSTTWAQYTQFALYGIKGA